MLSHPKHTPCGLDQYGESSAWTPRHEVYGLRVSFSGFLESRCVEGRFGVVAHGKDLASGLWWTALTGQCCFHLLQVSIPKDDAVMRLMARLHQLTPFEAVAADLFAAEYSDDCVIVSREVLQAGCVS